MPESSPEFEIRLFKAMCFDEQRHGQLLDRWPDESVKNFMTAFVAGVPGEDRAYAAGSLSVSHSENELESISKASVDAGLNLDNGEKLRVELDVPREFLDTPENAKATAALIVQLLFDIKSHHEQ